MAYKTLTQMTANMLDPVRGWWDERQLSRVCPVNDPDNNKVLAGMVGYLNADNEFVLGGGPGSKNKMPLFARGGSEDNDAVRYEGNMASQRATKTQGTPARVGSSSATLGANVGISCLVGTGAYELGTTAFVSGITAGQLLMASTAEKGKIATHAPSTAGAANSLYTATGAVTSVTLQSNQVIGIATSDSNVKNQYGVGMVYFYVNWWPAI